MEASPLLQRNRARETEERMSRRTAAVDDDDDEDDGAVLAHGGDGFAGAGSDDDGVLEAADPSAVCERPLRILGVQSGSPVAWSSNGRHLAFVSGSRAVYVCSRRDGGRFVVGTVLTAHEAAVRTLLFHSTLPWLVSCGEDGFFVWNFEESKLLWRMRDNTSLQHVAQEDQVHDSSIMCAMWICGEATLATGSKDGSLSFWDALSGFAHLETDHVHKASVLCFAFEREKNILVSAGRDSSIKFWDVSSLAEHNRANRCADLSISIVKLGNIDGAHRGDITALAWNPNAHQLFSGARDNCIKVWDVERMRELRTIQGHHGDIRKLIPLQDSRMLLSCGCDRTVKVWEIAQQEHAAGDEEEDVDIVRDFLSEAEAMYEFGEAPNDRILASINAHDDDVQEMAFASGQALLATSSSSNCVRIWSLQNATTITMVHEYVGHTGPVRAVALLKNDSLMLSASDDYHIHVCDSDTCQRSISFDFGGSVLCACISPNGSFVFVGGNDYVIKERDKFGRPVALLRGHFGKVIALSCVEYARKPGAILLVSAGHDFDICTWVIDSNMLKADVVELKPKCRVKSHSGHVMGLSFNSMLSELATCGSDHAVNVYAVRGHRLSKVWERKRAHHGAVSAVCWGREDRCSTVFSGSWDSNIKVWDTKEGKRLVPLAVLRGHRSRVTGLETCEEFPYLASSSTDCTIRLWSTIAPFDCVAKYSVPNSEHGFNCIGIGTRCLISGSENAVVRLWPLYFDGAGGTPQDGFHVTRSAASVHDRQRTNGPDGQQQAPAGADEELVFEEQLLVNSEPTVRRRLSSSLSSEVVLESLA